MAIKSKAPPKPLTPEQRKVYLHLPKFVTSRLKAAGKFRVSSEVNAILKAAMKAGAGAPGQVDLVRARMVLDSDVDTWLRKTGPGWQRFLRETLQEAMHQDKLPSKAIAAGVREGGNRHGFRVSREALEWLMRGSLKANIRTEKLISAHLRERMWQLRDVPPREISCERIKVVLEPDIAKWLISLKGSPVVSARQIILRKFHS